MTNPLFQLNYKRRNIQKSKKYAKSDRELTSSTTIQVKNAFMVSHWMEDLQVLPVTFSE